MKNKVNTLSPIIAATLAVILISPIANTANMVELVSPDAAEPVVNQREVTAQREVSVNQREVYGPITNTDTLWSIASRYRPSNNVTVHQVTAAIYKLNPHAFSGGNINAMIPGGAIRIPSERDIKKISHKQAVKIIASKPKKPKKKKQVVTTRSDGKRVVKYSPKGPKTKAETKQTSKAGESVSLDQYRTLNVEFAQASALLKRQNAEIKEYQLSIAALEQELSAKTPAASTGSPTATLLAEQEKVQHLTEVNHGLKIKSQAFDVELAALQAELDKNKQELEKSVKELNLEKSKAVAPVQNAVEESKASDDLYTQLVSQPLNLLMMVVVYTLLLLVIIVLFLRIRGKKEIDEQEKDLAESPMGVMAEEDNEFDSLLSDEEELDTDFPDLSEELQELDLAEDVQSEAEPELSDELDMSDFESESVELSDFDEIDDAPDLVPAPTESFATLETEDDLDLSLDTDLDISLDETVSDEPAPLDFPSKAEENIGELEAEVDSEISLDLDIEPELNLDADIEPELNLDADIEPELNLDADIEPELNLDADIEPELNLDADTEPEPSLDLEADIELDLAVELDLAELDSQVPNSADVKDKEFVDIEKLMEGSDSEVSDADPYDAPSLDVGLDDFPDLLSEHENVDVDADASGVNTQLDLARAYLEIDDKSGAKAILEEVVSKGNESQIAEAKALLEKID